MHVSQIRFSFHTYPKDWRLAIFNDSAETEIDSDVDAAAAAMLSFKHGPIILNHNKGTECL